MKTKEKQIKAIIFDLDGVIFDSESEYRKIYKEVNSEFHFHLTERERQAFNSMKWANMKGFLKEKYPNLDAESYVNRVREKTIEREKLEKPIKMKKGFLHLIEFLKTRDVKIALATSSNKAKVNKMFASYNLDCAQIFDVISCSNEVEHAKPAPDIYNLACERLGTTPDECLVLEDSIGGITSATAAGCKIIVVRDKILPPKEVRQNCIKIVNNLKNAEKFVKKHLK